MRNHRIQSRRRVNPLLSRIAICSLLLFSLCRSANAEVVTADALLQVVVRVDSIMNPVGTVLPGSTGSAQVVESSAIGPSSRFASSAAETILNDGASRTASFSDAFQKLPTNGSGGFAATAGKLVYRFETDTAATLFLETANAASLQQDGSRGSKGPFWRFSSGERISSGLNITESWMINVPAGMNELVLAAASSGVPRGERFFASGQFSTIFN